MSEIPKRLNPDSLKDTIVEIRFNSNLPEELLIGEIYHLLNEREYQYVSNPNLQQVQGGNKVGLALRNYDPVFFNDIITIRPKPNSFVLNTKGNYPLWSIYFDEIAKFLQILMSSKTIVTINRVGLRYINTFENVNIFENVNSVVNLNINGCDYNQTSLKTEYYEDPYRIIINLGNGINLIPENKVVSVVDIDVICEIEANYSSSKILEIINEAHNIEKRLFFLQIVKSDFWKKFDPTY